MSVQKAQRLTVRSHNIEFLKTLASQMGITDLSEVLNYLLLDCKGLCYTFGNKPQAQPQPTQASLGYSFDTSTYEPAFVPDRECDTVGALRDRNQIDPTIQRLIDAGLEMDF